MRHPSRPAACLAILFLGCATVSAHADFIMLEWGLNVGVHQNISGTVWDAIFDIENPLVHEHTITMGLSEAEAEYLFSWGAGFGSFHIDGADQIHANEPSGSASTSGTMYFTSSTDLTIDISAAYTYDLPTGLMDAGLYTRVRNVDTGDTLFGRYELENTILSGAAGTFTIDGSVVIPAGPQYRFSYGMLVGYSSTSDTLATGSGFVDFTITPEPGTLALLAAFIFILPRHRHRLAKASTNG